MLPVSYFRQNEPKYSLLQKKPRTSYTDNNKKDISRISEAVKCDKAFDIN